MRFANTWWWCLPWAAAPILAQEPVDLVGRVLDDRGVPLARAVVAGIPSGHAVVTDADGGFRAPDFRNAPLTLLVSLWGHRSVQLDLDGPRPKNFEVRLRRAGSVRGRVVGRTVRPPLPWTGSAAPATPGCPPPVQAPVWDARSLRHCPGATWQVAADGSFVAGNLCADSVRLVLSVPHHLAYVTPPVHVVPGEVTDIGTVNLAPMGRLYVVVVDGAGRRVDGAQVRVTRPTVARPWSPTPHANTPGPPGPGCGPMIWPRTRNGLYEVEVAEPGTHRISAFDPAHGTSSRETTIDLRPSEHRLVELVVETPEERARAERAIAGSLRLKSGALDVMADWLDLRELPSENRNPNANANTPSLPRPRTHRPETLPSGEFLFANLKPGRYLLQWRTGDQAMVFARALDIQPVTVHALELDGVCGSLRIALSHAVDAGVVLRPERPSHLCCSFAPGPVSLECTRGVCVARALPPGRYAVEIKSPDHATRTLDSIEVLPGQMTGVEAFLRPRAAAELSLAWTDDVPFPGGLHAELTSLATGTTRHAQVQGNRVRFDDVEAGAHRLVLVGSQWPEYFPPLRVASPLTLAPGTQRLRVAFRPEALR